MLGTVQIVAVGRVKTPHWRDALTDYATRLRRYTDFHITEVKDAVGQGSPDAVAVRREGDALLSESEAARHRILLTPGGESFDSRGFSLRLQDWLEQHHHLAFLIGGPVGFSPHVLQAAPSRLSLSKMTLPHELARVVLLEQLYRAFTILGGEKYHK
jgi:23S rRNA (pseudouridine1915-N3)-methyltransferase